MPILHHVIPAKLVATVVTVAAAGAAALVGNVRSPGRYAPAPHMSFASAWASAPIVPAGDTDLATDWQATTDPKVRVLFSYHRSDSGCAGPCERFQMVLRFTEPSGGAPEPSASWRDMAGASCARFAADGGAEELCEGDDAMAGRDRHGNDYVLLQLYSSRVQLARLLASHDLALQVGGDSFRLSPAARAALRTFLGTAGRAIPR